MDSAPTSWPYALHPSCRKKTSWQSISAVSARGRTGFRLNLPTTRAKRQCQRGFRNAYSIARRWMPQYNRVPNSEQRIASPTSTLPSDGLRGFIFSGPVKPTLTPPLAPCIFLARNRYKSLIASLQSNLFLRRIFNYRHPWRLPKSLHLTFRHALDGVSRNCWPTRQKLLRRASHRFTSPLTLTGDHTGMNMRIPARLPSLCCCTRRMEI